MENNLEKRKQRKTLVGLVESRSGDKSIKVVFFISNRILFIVRRSSVRRYCMCMTQKMLVM